MLNSIFIATLISLSLVLIIEIVSRIRRKQWEPGIPTKRKSREYDTEQRSFTIEPDPTYEDLIQQSQENERKES